MCSRAYYSYGSLAGIEMGSHRKELLIGEVMEKYINEPVNYAFTDEDIRKEYERFNDIKRVSAAFCLDSKTVKQILKKEGVL